MVTEAEGAEVHWGAGDSVALAGFLQVGVLALAAGYAARQVGEARTLRREQTRPYIVVYADLNEVARPLIDLVIENVGQRPGHDVSITFAPPLESSLDRSDGGDHVGEWVALKEGIPYLAPGQRMTHLFDSSISRYAKRNEMTQRYEVTVRYSELVQRGFPLSAESLRYEEKYTIDLAVWYGSHYTTQLGIHDAAQNLEKIAKRLESWTQDLNGVRSYVVDAEKHEQASRDRHERMVERLKTPDSADNTSTEE